MNANEIFTDYLNSLDDPYYFLVANLVLGRVQTPYHKPVLNGKILSFLLNAQNRANICASLDQADVRYLSFLRLAGRVSPSDVHAFFSDDSYPVLLTALANLRDRLLVIGSENEIFINPVLADDLDRYLDPDAVLGEDLGTAGGFPHVDRNVVFAMLNLLSNGSVPTRESNAHHFLKSGRLQSVFPQFPADDIALVFKLLRALFVSSGATIVEEGRFIIDRTAARGLLESDVLNLAVRCAGLEHGASIASFLGILRTHSIVKDAAARLLRIMMRTDEETANDVLKLLECFGILHESGTSVHFNETAFAPAEGRSPIHADTDMAVSYFGVPDADDILFLFADIVICDKLVTYRLSKDSFQRALEAGIDAGEIRSYLGEAAPIFPLEQWEKSLSRIRLYDGILLRCDPQVFRIVTGHPKLQEHIVSVAGDGMIVMDRRTFRQWQEILAYSLDMDHLPIPEGAIRISDSDSNEAPQTFALPEKPFVKNAETAGPDSAALKQELLDEAQRQGCLTEDVKALIDGRLIVSKDQIGKNFRFATRARIGGFDYSAKVAALKRLLKGGATLLELELTDGMIVAMPIDMIKDSSGKDILRVKVLPGNGERGIPVSSVFMATEMRWSLA
ncbi:MAG: hypothetical protein J5775_03895 [Spirochaetales bacterium]|nr:hypothetical protein [Spirochaetales bacterium]